MIMDVSVLLIVLYLIGFVYYLWRSVGRPKFFPPGETKKKMWKQCGSSVHSFKFLSSEEKKKKKTNSFINSYNLLLRLFAFDSKCDT